MEKRSFILVALVLALAFGTFTLASTVPQANAPAKKADSKPDKPKCLGCHGPYEKIIAATANFKASSGETLSPHRYVPHAEKKDIPECTECHTPHPVPIQSKDQAVKPNNVDWCYMSCHHAYNLQPCKNCH